MLIVSERVERQVLKRMRALFGSFDRSGLKQFSHIVLPYFCMRSCQALRGALRDGPPALPRPRRRSTRDQYASVVWNGLEEHLPLRESHKGKVLTHNYAADLPPLLGL